MEQNIQLVMMLHLRVNKSETGCDISVKIAF